MIPVPTPLNDSVINPTQLSLVCQQSSRSSHNTTHDLQACSIPSCTSPDPSNTMPPPSTKNESRNIYGCIVGVSKLKQSQRQQHAVMLLHNYHQFFKTNETSSMFVSPPPIPNIESWSQSTISSLYSGSFGINRSDVNIQQPTTSEVVDTENLMAYNEYIYPPPTHDILNVFSAADFPYQSSFDSAKYKCAWIKSKVIPPSILSAG